MTWFASTLENNYTMHSVNSTYIQNTVARVSVYVFYASKQTFHTMILLLYQYLDAIVGAHVKVMVCGMSDASINSCTSRNIATFSNLK